MLVGGYLAGRARHKAIYAEQGGDLITVRTVDLLGLGPLTR